MKIQYVHGSKFGNGATVAEAFGASMAAAGVTVDVHHVKEIRPNELPAADLYVFSSPGRFGKPTHAVRRFLEGVTLPPGTRYALLTTEMQPQPDEKTGVMPTEEEICRYQRVRPIMTEILGDRGLVKTAEEKVYVTGLKGPLEAGWRDKVEAFANRIVEVCLPRDAAATA